MRILEVNNFKDFKKNIRNIERINEQGIKITPPMIPGYLIKVNNLSQKAANIVRDEMISIGADAAVSSDSLAVKTRKADCFLLGNLSQLNQLNNRLRAHHNGLHKLSKDLSCNLKNYKRESFVLDIGRHRLRLGQRTFIMGIVNLTPDSFSQDGLYRAFLPGYRKTQISNIVKHIKEIENDGADIIDIGGESSRPGARPISIKEEISRTIPVINILVRKIKVPISIDTYKPEVAKAALDSGVSIINDISGLRNKKMARIAAKYKCGVIIMHMKGRPCNMQKNPVYRSLIDEIISYLDKSIKFALDCGVDREKMIIDPGIGFGKTLNHNLHILKSLKEFKILGRPILIGPSRKSFIGKILSQPAGKRIFGTLAVSVLAALNGADILRVHDVKEVKQALKVYDAIARI